MELAVVLFIMLALVVASVAVVLGVPFIIGLVAYDIIDSRKHETEKAFSAEEETSRIALKRGVARAFVILGSVFWSVATFFDVYTQRSAGYGSAVLAALVPLAVVLVTLVIGWYWERLTAIALLAASIGVMAWGVVYGFAPEMWAIVTLTLIGPMLTASVLFWAARRQQEAYELETAVRPQLAFAFAARSTLSS
jgi:hypothetical protein